MIHEYGYDMVADSTKVSEYDQEIPQSHSTDQRVAPRGGVA